VGECPLTIEGIIDSRPDWRETGGRIYLRTARIFRGKWSAAVTGRMILSIGEGRSCFLTGDRVRFVSAVRKPRNFGVPGEFDYERYLAFRDVHATAFVPSASDVILIRSGVAYPFQRRVDGIAADLGNRIGARLPGNEGAVLRALLLGEAGGVPKGIRDLYTRTGVNHILSISGFHVGVIAFFIFHLAFWVARRSEFLLLRTQPRRIILVLTIPVILFYLFLTGGAPATVRSVVMIVVYIAALLLDRETDPLNSLMLAALFILACSPVALFDISFQLSFFALWGILALTPILMAPFGKPAKGALHWLLLFFMASVAATAATLVPVSFYFHRTTLTGLLSNFFIVPLMGYGSVVLGFSALPCLHLFPSFAGLLLEIAGFLVKISTDILAYLDEIPLLPVWRTTRFDLLLCFLTLSAVTFLPQGRMRRSGCCFLVVLFVATRLVITDSDAGKLRLDFFSVGQGEATLVTFPNGARMIVDGGGSYRGGGMDPGERLLAPALWSRGIGRLDYLVLSHAHPDHMKGLLFLARTFSIGEFWESGVSDAGDDYQTLKRILAEKRVPVRRIDAATVPIRIGTVAIEPLSPHGPSGAAVDLNESSLVFRLRLDGFAVLFTGDIGPDVEGELIRNPSALRCTVLKAPHHGSRASSSEAFLAAALPSCALIGAGYENRFHLPSQETLSRLRKQGSRVLRTDLDGTITVIFANGKWGVSAFGRNGHFH
jgi:competence protein ComEC